MLRSFIGLAACVVVLSGCVHAESSAPSAEPAGQVVPAAARPALEAALRPLLSTAPYDSLKVGLFARRQDGTVLAASNADRPLLPASTQKLLTTTCALDRLGPAHTFRTEFLASGAIRADGSLSGPLYIRGAGHPQFRAEEMWSAARQLAALGLEKLPAGLVADDSLHGGEIRPGSWAPPRVTDPYDASQSAFAIAWNSLELIVRPTRPGAPAAISTFPVRAPVRVTGQVTTGTKTSVKVSVGRRAEASSPTRVSVSGTIAAGARPHRRWLRLGDPTANALSAFAEMLELAGVDVGSSLTRGTTPADAQPLSHHDSPPLTQLVHGVNKYSSNFGAELLLRALAVHSGSFPGSTADGTRALHGCLAELGVRGDALVLADGSGYSRKNRLTARALVDLLDASATRPDWFAELAASLPRAGEDGSLARRLAPLTGRVRAKTGSLTGVQSLAGYAWTERGERISFAVLLNGPSAISSRHVDRLVRTLVEAADRAPGTN